MQHQQSAAFPLVADESFHELMEHMASGTTYNERTSPEKVMSPEQEMWAQMIWYAVYESTGAGRGKLPCDECHGDYFDENPDRLVDRGRKGKVKPHCHPECPCGKFGHTFQQCALDFLNGPDLQLYLDLAGDLNADYLRRLIAKGGAKKWLYTGKDRLKAQGENRKYDLTNRRRRVVRSGNSVRV